MCPADGPWRAETITVLHRFPGQGWVTGRKQRFLVRGNVSQLAPLALRLKLVWSVSPSQPSYRLPPLPGGPLYIHPFSATPSTPFPPTMRQKKKYFKRLHKLNSLMS